MLPVARCSRSNSSEIRYELREEEQAQCERTDEREDALARNCRRTEQKRVQREDTEQREESQHVEAWTIEADRRRHVPARSEL